MDLVNGIEGWLFHGQGANRWLDYYSGKLRLSDSIIEDWVFNLTSVQEKFKQLNCGFEFILIPEKHTVVPAMLPSEFSCSASPFSQSFLSALNDLSIRPIGYQEIISEGFDGKFHCKTDSHLSADGVYRLYQLILTRLGCNQFSLLPEIDFCFSEKIETGDLGRKLLPNQQSVVRKLGNFKNFTSVLSKINTSNLGFAAHFCANKTAINKKILLFGNSFAKHDLIELLARTFQETLFVFYPFPDIYVCKEFQPDIVILQTNERFVPVGPSNFLNPTFRVVGLQKLLYSRQVENESFMLSSLKTTFIALELTHAVNMRSGDRIRSILLGSKNMLDPYDFAAIALLCSSKIGDPSIIKNIGIDLRHYQKANEILFTSSLRINLHNVMSRAPK